MSSDPQVTFEAAATLIKAIQLAEAVANTLKYENKGYGPHKHQTRADVPRHEAGIASMVRELDDLVRSPDGVAAALLVTDEDLAAARDHQARAAAHAAAYEGRAVPQVVEDAAWQADQSCWRAAAAIERRSGPRRLECHMRYTRPSVECAAAVDFYHVHRHLLRGHELLEECDRLAQGELVAA